MTNSIFWTTVKQFDYLPLPTDHLPQKYWLTAENNKEEMEWQEQAFSEEELIELINDAIKNGFTVKVESI
jgi:hypothetical protein